MVTLKYFFCSGGSSVSRSTYPDPEFSNSVFVSSPQNVFSFLLSLFLIYSTKYKRILGRHGVVVSDIVISLFVFFRILLITRGSAMNGREGVVNQIGSWSKKNENRRMSTYWWGRLLIEMNQLINGVSLPSVTTSITGYCCAKICYYTKRDSGSIF